MIKPRSIPTGRWRRWMPPRPMLFVLLAYLLAMVFFSLLRGLFYYNFTEYTRSEATGEIITAFLIGLRFDQIIVLATLLPLTLLLPWIDLKRAVFRRIVTIWVIATFAIHFLLLLADIRFYSYFDSRLNFLAVEYIGEGPLFGNLIVSDPQFYQTIFVWLLLTVLFSGLLLFIRKKLLRIPHRRSMPNHIVYAVLFVALSVLGIRGRISLAPMDWGIAYFSENRFLNQLALNGIYTLGRNLSEANRDPRIIYLPEDERFPLVTFDEALATTQDMVVTSSDSLLEPQRSLLRKTGQPAAPYGFRPNVVIILSESWSAQLTGALGSPRNLTPNFDRLASGGLLFENFYASGTRTNFGISAVFCSFPALPGRAIMKRYNARHPFVALSEILAGRGYHNAFVYGGDLAFDNMEGFLREKKFHSFHGDTELGRDLYFSKWGIPDHILFEKAVGLIDTLPRPFQATILTLSNHEPWDLPDSTVRRYFDDADSSKVFNSQIYADHALGHFFELAGQAGFYDSTIFVFVSDHARYGRSRFLLDTRLFRIPLLIYAPGIKADLIGRARVFGGQTDILPTLMGLLGADYTHASWGRNLLDLPEGDGGFAIMDVADRIGYIDPDYLYVEELSGLTGYGARTLDDNDGSWFGYATLRAFDVVGKKLSDSNWVRVYASCLDETSRFTVMYALNRIGAMGRGHLLLQTLRAPDSDPNADEPPGLVRSRERLRRFMQAADQLSAPEER